MNGKQPRYGPTPVMSNETTSVVPLKGKQMHIRRCQFSHKLDVRADVVLFFNKACQPPEHQYCSHVWVCPSEDIYTHQMDVFHDIQPNADQGQGVRLITLLLQSPQNNLHTCASTITPPPSPHHVFQKGAVAVSAVGLYVFAVSMLKSKAPLANCECGLRCGTRGL